MGVLINNTQLVKKVLIQAYQEKEKYHPYSCNNVKFVERYFYKPSIEISVSDIEEFVEKKIEENITLDYKDIAILQEPKKILKHVCGFANSIGGLLIIGISESEAKESPNSVKIYPQEITWGDGSVTKETLEQIIRSGIEPEPSFYILPVRKSKNASDVIYLIDVERSDYLHKVKEKGVFYRRKNFETVPIPTIELMTFVKEKIGLEKCAYFRGKLELALVEFVDEALFRIMPECKELNPYASVETRRQIVSTFKELMRKDANELYPRFSNAPHAQLAKLSLAVDKLGKDLEEIEKYPHQELAPDEQDLYTTLKDAMNESYHVLKEPLDWNGERRIRVRINYLKKLGLATVIMLEKIDELRDKYGNPAVRNFIG